MPQTALAVALSSGGPRLGIHGKNASTALQSRDTQSRDKERIYIHGKNASTGAREYIPTKHGTKLHDRQCYRYALQSAARELLPREAVASCMRDVVPGEHGPAVSVLYSPVQKAAHYGGLKCCKSVWHCPVCSAKISERRRLELSHAVATWRGPIVMATYTLQHNAGDSLQDVLNALKAARRGLMRGRAAVAFNEAHSIAGMVRSLELTYGDHGWHPHMHCLVFLDGLIDIAGFEDQSRRRWAHAVAATGRYASWQHGCDVRYTNNEIADYVAKFGREPKWTPAHEIAKAVSKAGRAGGRTPMQLLADYFAGDRASGRRWLEYAVNMKGQRQLFWSHGMREQLELETEQTDEEIAAEQDEIAVMLASLSVGAWRAVLANDARAELLFAAATGDEQTVKTFLGRLGVPIE